jgi:hypothetical protein
MNTVLLYDFALCPCGFHTAIQPSTTVIPTVGLEPTETETAPLFVACERCNRIYETEARKLVAGDNPSGLEGHNPDATMKRFPMSIECDWPSCDTPIPIIVVRNSDTTEAALLKESTRWYGENLRCPSGHVQDFPLGTIRSR